MVIDHIYYPGRNQDYPAYVIRPKAAYVGPAVVMLHDRQGLTEYFLAWGERLAHEGFIVMLPDLYMGRKPNDDGQAKQWMNALALKEGREAVRMAVVWLRNQAYTREHATAVIGFERNGTLGLLTTTLKRFAPRAAIAIASPVKDLIEEAKEFHAAVQLHIPEKDKTVAKNTLDTFIATLASQGIAYEVHTYPNAKHDFMCKTCEDYDAEAERQVWERTLAFLQKVYENAPTAQAMVTS